MLQTMISDAFQRNPARRDVLDPVRAMAVIPRCPAYAVTPLRSVNALGRSVWVKDESDRFGLGSFKTLGGVYAVAQILFGLAQAEGAVKDAADPRDPRLREVARDKTFICASAGNHGIAVAAGTGHVGARARIHLPRSTPHGFEQRLKVLGASVCRSGDTYDDAMVAAECDARTCGGIYLSDRAASQNDEGPALVAEGYTVVAEELRVAFTNMRVWPTHVFVQAGVGGLAAAMAFHIRRFWAEQPEIIVVEPWSAACLAASHSSGRPTVVDGPRSVMLRLDCKAPSILALQILKLASVAYVSVSDEQARAAMLALSQLGIATTPSGAAGYAALESLAASLDARTTRPLVITTECAFADSDFEDHVHA